MCAPQRLPQLLAQLQALAAIRRALAVRHDELQAQALLDPVVDRLEVLDAQTQEGDLAVHAGVAQAWHSAQEALWQLLHHGDPELAVAWLVIAQHSLERARDAAQRSTWARAAG